MPPEVNILNGDCLEVLRGLPAESVQCCVTSPPYYGLRDYGISGQIGLEKTPQDYVQKLVEVFREVRRVLRNNGVLWLNLGDSYAQNGSGGHGATGGRDKSTLNGNLPPVGTSPVKKQIPFGLKTKDLMGIPWRVAFALQEDGWWLRSEITWCKTACMPESVIDRPTCATEKVFLMAKSKSYFYNSDAVREKLAESTLNDQRFKDPHHEVKRLERGFPGQSQHGAGMLKRKTDKQRGHSRRHDGFNDRWDAMSKEEQQANGRNMRNYWLLGPEPFKEAHFATFPTEIPKRAILASSKVGDLVIDPFGGSGTTGQVALELGRSAILIELNPKYCALAERRCAVTPGFL